MASSSVYASNRRQQTWLNSHQLRQQSSFSGGPVLGNQATCRTIGSARNNQTDQRRVKRSNSIALPRPQGEKNKFLGIRKQFSVMDQDNSGLRGKSEQKVNLPILNNNAVGTRPMDDKGVFIAGVNVAWSSATLPSDEEIALMRKNLQSGALLTSDSKQDGSSRFDFTRKPPSCTSSKSENKINLNIVLSPTTRATDNEVANSDVDSSSEGADGKKISGQNSAKKSLPETITEKIVQRQENRVSSAAQRRAQFKSHRGEETTSIGGTSTAMVVPPTVSIPPRPPLVRAMSAPVRPLDISRGVLPNNRRKVRRRKFATRNTKYDGEDYDGTQVMGRTRPTTGSDVITFVTLISSEGSDSEKDESDQVEDSQRAPSLRKAGKSVSFQDNDPPDGLNSVKELPNMIRRGSMLPFAARLKSNRPPTAPPVSIFLRNYEACQKSMETPGNVLPSNIVTNISTNKENNAPNNKTTSIDSVEYDFPVYVRTIKERECWKMFKKMSNKGISVTYDTILRGMLTPTEFRQLQNQRELDDAKNRADEEDKPGINSDSNVLLLAKK